MADTETQTGLTQQPSRGDDEQTRKAAASSPRRSSGSRKRSAASKTQSADKAKTVKRTVRRPFFSYAVPATDATGDAIKGPNGKQLFYTRVAYKGEEIDVYPQDAARGDAHGVFLQEGETLDDQTSLALRLSDLGLLTDDQLRLMWDEKPPKEDDLLEAVGENSDLAVKVLSAEQASDKPRTGLLKKLQTIADGTPALEGGDQ